MSGHGQRAHDDGAPVHSEGGRRRGECSFRVKFIISSTKSIIRRDVYTVSRFYSDSAAVFLQRFEFLDDERFDKVSDLFTEVSAIEAALRHHNSMKMAVYGILNKQRHGSSTLEFNIYMFVVDGAEVKYYVLGETEAEGGFGINCMQFSTGFSTDFGPPFCVKPPHNLIPREGKRPDMIGHGFRTENDGLILDVYDFSTTSFLKKSAV